MMEAELQRKRDAKEGAKEHLKLEEALKDSETQIESLQSEANGHLAT